MGIKVIVTGVTGMVGEGILLECLDHQDVDLVLAVCRKPLDLQHPKLKVFLTSDFMKIDSNESALTGYDACFYCAGISSNGLSEEKYSHITYDTTIYFAEVVKKLNPGLVFNFVSGSHTDSSEKGKVMWARIKGKTENALIKMFPGKSYNFRPALMKPRRDQKHFYGYNKVTHKVLFPILKLIFPYCSLQEMAQAMINATKKGYEKSILENSDIKKCAVSL